LVSVAKFIAERGLAFRDDKTLDCPESFPKKFQNIFQANIKIRICDASSDWFCNNFTNR